MLLKAGMTIKQAMICNLVSSLLCLMGVVIGLAIGSAHESASWIFASTAGMFIYIALVDMVRTNNSVREFCIQFTRYCTWTLTHFNLNFVRILGVGTGTQRAHGYQRFNHNPIIDPASRPVIWLCHHVNNCPLRRWIPSNLVAVLNARSLLA